MLLSTYKFYKDTLEVYIKDKIDNLNKMMSELEVIKKIRPHISDVTKKTFNINEVCKILAEMAKCEIELVKEVVDKYKIRKLLSISTDIKGTKKEISLLKKDLKNIKEVCFNRYKELCGD